MLTHSKLHFNKNTGVLYMYANFYLELFRPINMRIDMFTMCNLKIIMQQIFLLNFAYMVYQEIENDSLAFFFFLNGFSKITILDPMLQPYLTGNYALANRQ